MRENNTSKSLKVWDPLVRIGHWLLVGSVLTAYASGDDFQDIHIVAGYTVASVVVFRLIWGFIGTKHARFSDFVRGPKTVFSYLSSLLNGRAKRCIGHNPAGAVMILALLFSLIVTTGSGLALLAVEKNKGPLAPFLPPSAMTTETGSSSATAKLWLTSADEDDDDEGEYEHGHSEESPAEELLEGVHKTFTYLTLFLAGLHFIGVFVSGRLHNENLVTAMFTGRKKKD